MKYVLAVDGGNSKTLAIVADETGGILSAHKGGGTNYQAIGRENTSRALKDIISAALSKAGVKKIEAACYGLAGADREKDFQVFRQILAPIDPARKSVLVNDTILALRAGTDDGVGVALIGGAGSNCIGMDKKGRIKKAGGLGPLTGDKANAGQLVIDAAVEALKGVDGRGPKTLIEDKFKKALGLEALEDVIEFEFADSRRGIKFGMLAPLVFEAANEKDKVALQLLREHGKAAGEAALAVMRGLFSKKQAVPLVLGGSVLQKGGNPTLIRTIKRTVAREFPRITLIKLEDPPVMGGIMRALDEIGKPPPAGTRKKIRAELKKRLRENLKDNGIK
jgi:N-acetylglucosamine kinase-like BadF-type ATPase